MSPSIGSHGNRSCYRIYCSCPYLRGLSELVLGLYMVISSYTNITSNTIYKSKVQIANSTRLTHSVYLRNYLTLISERFLCSWKWQTDRLEHIGMDFQKDQNTDKILNAHSPSNFKISYCSRIWWHEDQRTNPASKKWPYQRLNLLTIKENRYIPNVFSKVPPNSLRTVCWRSWYESPLERPTQAH